MPRLSNLVALVALVLSWTRQVLGAKGIPSEVSLINDSEIESDWTAIYYSPTIPLLLGNDGSAASGGFHVWELDHAAPLPDVKHLTPGRTKLVTTAYNVGGRDLAVSIAQPDSVMRVFEIPSFEEVEGARYKALGDWSALCSWRSKGGNEYLHLFGKNVGVQFLLREGESGVEIVKIQSFDLPIEPSGCAVSYAMSRMFMSADDDKDLYSFSLEESIVPPSVSKDFEAEHDVTGVAIYYGKGKKEYLLVAQEDKVAIYSLSFDLLGTIELTGLEDIEIQGLSIHQSPTENSPQGLLAFAIEADDAAGFGLMGLKDPFAELDIKTNTKYNPRKATCGKNPICNACSTNGFCASRPRTSSTACECFTGFAGRKCEAFTCTNNCSGRGECTGPDTCSCEPGWGGLHCSFRLVEPKYETTANGDDGDDPAIWVSPEAPELSRIITTTKAGDGAGLGVFDLTGKLIQTIGAGEPNNVDVIYGFELGERSVDLVFAACREDDTLCLFEITPNGTLVPIPGGIQPVVPDFSVYGSCAYRSPTSGKQYLFVNEKSSRYLQYELTADANGALLTTLVRDFFAGSGGQVEGCVVDEANAWLFLGEEPSALWRSPAEPDSSLPGVAIATVGDGHLFADVEGVTLVYGHGPDEGFILVSCQGVSAYNVYRRAEPHEYVMTFTIAGSSDGEIDAVSNTDGIAAIGTSLGADFPHGLVVVHDDANELPDGGTSADASFKLLSLGDILGTELLSEVDDQWDPRA